MTVKQLFEILDVDVENEVTIRVNGFDKELSEVPVENFGIEELEIRLKNHNSCEITVYLD